MTDDALELECRLRFIQLCIGNHAFPPPTGMDLYVEGFWGAVEAMRQPRDAEALGALMSMAQARAAGLIK